VMDLVVLDLVDIGASEGSYARCVVPEDGFTVWVRLGMT
jgi:hypothetical protein